MKTILEVRSDSAGGELAPSSIAIRRCAMQEIQAHAREGYPNEVVGILAGDRRSRSVVRAEPLVNERVDRLRDRYHVDGLALLRAERRLRVEGLLAVGYYHSHPDHPARFSAFDLQHAQPGMSYLILSVYGGEIVEVQSWRLTDDGTDMWAETIEIGD